jgi:GAG-pre-integrase domain
MKNETALLTEMEINHLYHLDVHTSLERSYTTELEIQNMSQLEALHQKLGHLNYSAVKSIATKDLIEGICIPKHVLNATPPPCEACKLGKAQRASFPPSRCPRAENVLDMVYSDMWGPAPVQTINGARYMLTFTDGCSR